MSSYFYTNITHLYINMKCKIDELMNEWPFILIDIDIILCERTGMEPTLSVMLIMKFTRITPWIYPYV